MWFTEWQVAEDRLHVELDERVHWDLVPLDQDWVAHLFAGRRTVSLQLDTYAAAGRDASDVRTKTGPSRLLDMSKADPTVVAPVVTFDDPALEHRTTVVEVLPDRSQAQLIQPTKGGQIRVGKSNLGRFEVFLMGSVGTSIRRRPRPHSAQRRARHAHLNYTPNCEEPLYRPPNRVSLPLHQKFQSNYLGVPIGAVDLHEASRWSM